MTQDQTPSAQAAAMDRAGEVDGASDKFSWPNSLVQSAENRAEERNKNAAARARLDAMALALAPALAGDVQPVAQTDLSKRLRALAIHDSQPIGKLMGEAADEIDRYYGGMLAWKQTAETKDRKLSEEIAARVDERVAARLAAAPPQPVAQPAPAPLEVMAAIESCRADILHDIDGLDNDQTNSVLGVFDYYLGDLVAAVPAVAQDAQGELVAWWNTKYQTTMPMSRMSEQLGGMEGIMSSPAFQAGELVPLYLSNNHVRNGWYDAAKWIRNNYQDYANVASICEAMKAAAPPLPAVAPQEQSGKPVLMAYIATDLDGHADVGMTIEKAKERAGHGCDTIIALHDISCEFVELEGNAVAKNPAVLSVGLLRSDVIEDLRLLVGRLVVALRKATPDNVLADQATNYLDRAGLKGSPLRSLRERMEVANNPKPFPPKKGA